MNDLVTVKTKNARFKRAERKQELIEKNNTL